MHFWDYDVVKEAMENIGAYMADYRYSAVATGGVVVAMGAWLALRLYRNHQMHNLFAEWAEHRANMCRVKLTMVGLCLDGVEAMVSEERQERIVTADLPELIHKLQSGEWEAVNVLRAYQAKALKVHDDTNCLIEPVFEAQHMAVECDDMVDKSRPLHGVPFSVKESVGLRGYVVTVGLGKACHLHASEDWPVVKMLKGLGAFPFMRTNFPQLHLSYEGSNPIFGSTTSHLDPTRIPGGSSSGEGALVGGGGSIFGIGTDIGGSIRAPAAFSGICAIKPSRVRVGIGIVLQPQPNHLLSAAWGVIGRDVESVALVLEHVLTPPFFRLDTSLPPLPFDKQAYESTRPLRIGYFVRFGRYPASRACERAVLESVAGLQAAGHTLVPWSPPNQHIVEEAAIAYFAADGGTALRFQIENEKVDKTIYPVVSLAVTPRWRLVLYAMFLSVRKSHKNYMDWIRLFARKMSLFEWNCFNSYVELYRREMSHEMDALELDVLLSPPFPIPTPKEGNSEALMRMSSYLTLYNVLDWPAGVVPVTEVTRADIAALKDYHTGDDIEELVRKDMADGEGLPVCVQVAGRKWQEETVLRVMRELQARVRD